MRWQKLQIIKGRLEDLRNIVPKSELGILIFIFDEI